MSNETIKQIAQTSSLCKDDEKANSTLGAQFIPHSTSKSPISVLSPHVAEFVPKSLVLKKESSCPRPTERLEEKSSWKEALDGVPTVERLPRKPGDDVEHSSRGWWDGAPLNIKIDRTFTRNLPKPHHTTRASSERAHRPPREYRPGFAWRQRRLSEEMDSNWRLRPSDSDQDKTMYNELRIGRDKKDTRNFPQNKKQYSLQGLSEGKKLNVDERRSGKEEDERVSQVMDNGQQKQQESVRTGAIRGRGRGRMAWMNHTQDHNNSTKNEEFKDSRIPDQDIIKIIGRGRGFRSNTFNHTELSTAPKQTSNSEHILTRNKHSNSDLTGKEKEMNGSLVTDDDGWIVVGNKKKVDEQKDSGKQMKEKMIHESQFSGMKSKEMKEMTVLNSQQKMEKWKRKKEQKKERKMDNIEQGRKTVENKEISSEVIIAPKDLGRQNKHYKTKSKAVLTTEQDSAGSMESGSKMNKNTQEKESRKVEIVKIIKTEQNQGKKEVKLLLKRNNEKKEPRKEQTAQKDPGFDLHEGDDEFPDLAATSSKAGGISLASDWLSGGSRMPIISYSAVLKAIPKPKIQPSRNLPNENGSSTTQEHDENEGQKKKKKKKKKKKAKDNEATAKQTPQEQKKTKQPMQFDLGDWLSTIEKNPPKISKDKQTNPKKAVTIATGVLQIKVKDQPSAIPRVTAVKSTHVLSTTDKTFHNILDSTAPVVKRGKEREVPKKKKPSQLKRIILKEREEKRKALDGDENQDEKSEDQSLAVEHNSSEETSDTKKFEEKSSNEDNDIIVSHSKDDVITHHHGDAITTPADLGSDGDQTVAPSEDDIKAQIHSRRFREYCDNVMDKELNNTTLQLLQKLVIFQDRQYHKDPVKSKAKRRFVVGLREVTKHLKLRKIKLVIVSPNVERIKSAGGLDDTLHNIISIAHQNGVPVVFALRRQVLGRVLHKKVPVSAVGVFYHDGAEDEYKKLMDLTEKAREVYAERWKTAYDELVLRIQKERAEDMSCDIQGKDLSAHDQCGEESEIPNEIPNETKNKMKIKKEQDKVSVDADKDTIIRQMSKIEENEKNECNRNQESEWEGREEMKDGPLEQKENISDESEDEDKLETVNIGFEKMELHEKNEIEKKWEGKEEMKDELLDQKENSSDKNEDSLKAEKIGNERMEPHEINEMNENERDNDDHPVSIQRDLTVE